MKNKLNVWGPGQLLAWSGLNGKTDYLHGLVLRTAFGSPALDIRWPENGGKISFDLPNDAEITLTGDFFELGGLRGAFVDAWHVLLDGDCRIEAGEGIKSVSAGKRHLIGAVGFFRPELLETDIDAAISQCRNALEKFPLPPGLTEDSGRTLWKTFSQLRTQVYTPEGCIKHRWTTPDRWPHRKMWLWDSVFHAIGIRHLDPALAREAISAVLDVQCEDGFIPHCAAPDYRSDITQPPVLALGVELVNASQPCPEWLREVYPKLKAYLEWDMAHRDTDGAGLLEWFIEEHVNCRSGESGMDNSPRFDGAIQLDATDFNAFLSMECETMARFAETLGLTEEMSYWQNHHARINSLINARLWNEEKGFYFDYDVVGNVQSDAMASSGFLPLICGAASPAQAARIVGHLHNPATFKTDFPVASIAVSDTAHYSKDMWRGPVWVNINWLIERGLRRYGFHADAEALRGRTMAEIEKMYLKYGTIFEYYDDRGEVDPPRLLRKADNIPNTYHQAFHDYGWTATLYIDMVFSLNNS